MLEKKGNNISLFVERTSVVGDVAVSLSFKSNLNTCTLNKLKGSCNCSCFPEGSEEACLCYALFLVIKNALCGDPLATARSKVGDVNCGSHNDWFFISWKIKGTGSAVRKSLGIVLKMLAPSKYFSVYSHCVKELNGKVNRDNFNYVADELNKSIKNLVHCGVVGNIKLLKMDPKTNKEVEALDLNEMVKMLEKKLKIEAEKGIKAKPKDHKPCTHEEYTELKVNGWASFVVKDYITAKVRGLNPIICNKYILLPVNNSRWDTFSKKIKLSVKDYINQKYANVKVKENLPAILGYMALSSASISCYDVHNMIKANIKPSDVEKVLNSVL